MHNLCLIYLKNNSEHRYIIIYSRDKNTKKRTPKLEIKYFVTKLKNNSQNYLQKTQIKYNIYVYKHLKEDLIMKLSKLILTTVATTFLLTSISADATVITRQHRTFKGNGTPASEALAKKCQTIWDEYEELEYQKDLTMAKTHDIKKVHEFTIKQKPLYDEMVKNRCL